MPHLLLHHKVQNFDTWKITYDEHATARKAAGFTELHLMRALSDRNDVVILFHLEDLAKARVFAGSDDLKRTMQRSGVIGNVELLELD